MENNQYFGTELSCTHSLAAGTPKAQSEMLWRLGLTFGFPGDKEDTGVTQPLFHDLKSHWIKTPRKTFLYHTQVTRPRAGDKTSSKFRFGNTACKACSQLRHSKGTTAWSGCSPTSPWEGIFSQTGSNGMGSFRLGKTGENFTTLTGKCQFSWFALSCCGFGKEQPRLNNTRRFQLIWTLRSQGKPSDSPPLAHEHVGNKVGELPINVSKLP